MAKNAFICLALSEWKQLFFFLFFFLEPFNQVEHQGAIRKLDDLANINAFLMVENCKVVLWVGLSASKNSNIRHLFLYGSGRKYFVCGVNYFEKGCVDSVFFCSQ